jgi:hypothetical protein
MGLSWMSPLFLVGAMAAAIPIALHLFLRRRAPVVEFAAMRYLTAAPIERESTRRLKEWLLLALRVAAIVALAVAFARPYLAASVVAETTRATVIMLDTSASMTAPGQFARAQAIALDVLNRVPVGESVGVVTFGAHAEVSGEVSSDRGAAAAAIRGAQAGAGATRYSEALARAADMFRGRPGTLVVVSDLQSSGWDASGAAALPATLTIEARAVAPPVANWAVEALRDEGNDLIATVANYSGASAARTVTFTRGGASLGRVTVLVPAGGTAEARTSLGNSVTGAVSATTDDIEGYTADNTRYAVVGETRNRTVTVITGAGALSESIYVSRALEAAEARDRLVVERLSGAQFSTGDAQAAPAPDVIVLLGTRGLDPRGRRRLAQFVRDGGGLLVSAGPDVETDVVNEALAGVVKTAVAVRDGDAPLTFAADDMRHPIFRALGEFGTLALVDFTRSVLVTPSASGQVVARFSDGSPALVDEATEAGGRVVLFASDLNNAWNRLPLQPAFPPLLTETVRYLAARALAPAEYFAGELAQLGGDVPGTLTADSGRVVAINVDPRESNPAATSPEEFSAAVAPLAAEGSRRQAEDVTATEQTQRLWQYGLAMMLGLLVTEGALARRMG